MYVYGCIIDMAKQFCQTNTTPDHCIETCSIVTNDKCIVNEMNKKYDLCIVFNIPAKKKMCYFGFLFTFWFDTELHSAVFDHHCQKFLWKL